MGDTGHLTLVPEYVEPAKRVPDNVCRGVRWICFLILVASTVLGLPTRSPGDSDIDHLFRDVQAGHASSVSIEDLGSRTTANDVRVRWKTSLFSWHQATTSPPPCVDGRLDTQYVSGTVTLNGPSAVGCEDADAVLRSYLGVAAGAQPIDVATFHSRSGPRVNVDFTTNLWAPLAAVTGFLWLATAIGMIFTREHPYANRWAWFWLFVIGGVGPMLILWKEPAPLRLRFWRRDTEPHRWTQPPMTGGIGLLMAIGWTIGITAVAYSLGWLASS